MALTQISTAGVKDDAVTAGKIPANAVGSSELADNAVDTAAIADQAVDLTKLPHGTGSNDGKFLRANNGADPSFETISIPAGTTINNQGDNRVITGDASANTLNAESNVTIDSSGRLDISPSVAGTAVTVASAGGTWGGNINLRNTQSSNQDWTLGVGGGDNAYAPGRGFVVRDLTNNASRLTINSSGNVGIGTVNAHQQLHVHDTTSYQGIILSGNGAPRIGFANVSIGQSGANGGAWSAGIDGTNGDQFVINNSNDNSNRKFIMSSTLTTLNQNTQVNGNLKFGSSGNGIDFSADGNASGNTSELLHDYEEGTWSANSLNYDYDGNVAQRGHYIKIGRMVFATFRVKFHSQTTHVGNHLRFTGLPFTAANGNPYDVGVSGVAHGYGEIATFRIYVQVGSTYAYWYTDTGSVFNNSTALNNKDIRGTIIYTASS